MGEREVEVKNSLDAKPAFDDEVGASVLCSGARKRSSDCLERRYLTRVLITRASSSFPSLLPDCEHLIRRMLVLDPSRRLSVAQIKEHKWMAPYVPVQRPVLHQQPLSVEGDANVGEYSEQVLRLMHSLGIDQHKTVEVRAFEKKSSQK